MHKRLDAAHSAEEQVAANVEVVAVERLLARLAEEAKPIEARIAEIEAARQREKLEAEYRMLLATHDQLLEQAASLVAGLEDYFRKLAQDWWALSKRIADSERQREKVARELGLLGPFKHVGLKTAGLDHAETFAFGQKLRLIHGGHVLQEILSKYRE